MNTIREFLHFFWSYLLTIKFTDVIDILAVAYLIYKLIAFLRKASVVRVTRGLILVVAVVWISNLLQLTVINYLLSKALDLGFIALIILFQPELRRILESVGQNSFSRFFSLSSRVNATEEGIDNIVLACSNFSESKTGALIVIERNNSLDEILKTGTVFNADIATDLFRSIFFDKSPLHDGAVIMRNGRIAAAGCMLPLSANVNLSQGLGMRHRAGIGVTEMTDAVAIIVSEENGSISVSTDGLLKRHLSAETLKSLLVKELLPQDSVEPRRIFKNSFKVKKDAKEEVR